MTTCTDLRTGPQAPISYRDNSHQPHTGTTGTYLADRTTGIDLTLGQQAPTIYLDEKTHAKKGRHPSTKKDIDLKEY